MTDTTEQEINLHGNFLSLFDTGVLITGDSGIGKGELTLELIDRGHQLIADDTPLFSRTSTGSLVGRCPKVLQDFLEVRGLGLLNIRKLFGDPAICPQKPLQLVVHLCSTRQLDSDERLQPTHSALEVLGINVPQYELVTNSQRNNTILLEALIRNHLLSDEQYFSPLDFEQRQRQKLDN